MPLVSLDSVLIGQVLVNLLENAIKYTPSDSPIDISAIYPTVKCYFKLPTGSGIRSAMKSVCLTSFIAPGQTAAESVWD